jgi:hypothetical protein
VKFTDEILENVDRQPSKYFDIGTHKVVIGLISAGTNDNGKEYIEFTVFDPADNERTGTARLWFTSEKAAGYAISIISTIFVHNTPEEKRDALKAALKKLTDTDALLDIAQKKLIGKEAFYVVEEDPTRTYTNKNGDVMPSVNRNIYGYEMKPKEDKKAEQAEIDAGAEAAFPDI